jgi:glycosyltransferase involved in cell wall biosynthesis
MADERGAEMRVWVVEAGEMPIQAAGGSRELRTGWLVKALHDRGHSVTWWTSTFDHGTKAQKYPSTCTKSVDDRLDLRFIWAPAYKRNLSLYRILHHRVLARSIVEAMSREATLPDLIFCAYPIPEIAERVVRFARQNKVPAVVDILDLWPDIYLNALPFLRGVGNFALFFERRRAARVMRNATAITAVSQSYLDWSIAKSGRTQGTLDGVFPLGYRKAEVAAGSAADRSAVRASLGAGDRTMIAVFSGVFGNSYDLDTIVDSAELLAESDHDVRFVLIGAGDKFRSITERTRNAKNITLLGWQSKERIAEVLPCCDVGLVSYTRSALQSLPYKPFEYMAMGLPLLSSLKGELAMLVSERGIGRVYEAENAHSLAEAVKRFAVEVEERLAMADSARKLFAERFESSIIYASLAGHLEVVASPARTGLAVAHEGRRGAPACDTPRAEHPPGAA